MVGESIPLTQQASSLYSSETQSNQNAAKSLEGTLQQQDSWKTIQ